MAVNKKTKSGSKTVVGNDGKQKKVLIGSKADPDANPSSGNKGTSEATSGWATGPAKTSPAATTPAPTTGGSTGTKYSRITGSPLAQKESQARGILYNTDPFNEKNARREALRFAGDEIRAIDDIYEVERQEALRAGERDLSRSNTLAAMAGLMGSPEGSTALGDSERRTKKNLEAVDARKRYELSSIYNRIDQNIQKEKEAARTSQKEAAQRILDEVAVEASNSLSSFASQGLSWEDLQASDPDTVKELVRQTGKDAFTLRKLYDEALPPDKKPRIIFEGFKGDNFITIRQNPDGTTTTDTMDSKELGIPDTFTDPSSITLGGNVYWYDKDAPLGKDGKPNLILLGAKDAPDSDDDGVDTDPGNPSKIPTFEEFIAAKQNEQQQSFTPDTKESYRPEYNELYGNGGVNLPKLNATQKREVAGAKLTNTDESTQSFFLATPPAFRQYFQREAATGNKNATDVNTLAEIYDAWVAEQEAAKKKKKEGDTPQLSDEEFLKKLRGE